MEILTQGILETPREVTTKQGEKDFYVQVKFMGGAFSARLAPHLIGIKATGKLQNLKITVNPRTVTINERSLTAFMPSELVEVN